MRPRADYPVTKDSIDAARLARDLERAALYRDTGILVLGDEGIVRVVPPRADERPAAVVSR